MIPLFNSQLKLEKNRANNIKLVNTDLKLILSNSMSICKSHAKKNYRFRTVYWKDDLIILESRNIKFKVLFQNFGPTFIVLYLVVKKVSEATYAVELPTTIRIHPVLHNSLLTKYAGPNPDFSKAIT